MRVHIPYNLYVIITIILVVRVCCVFLFFNSYKTHNGFCVKQYFFQIYKAFQVPTCFVEFIYYAYNSIEFSMENSLFCARLCFCINNTIVNIYCKTIQNIEFWSFNILLLLLFNRLFCKIPF